MKQLAILFIASMQVSAGICGVLLNSDFESGSLSDWSFISSNSTIATQPRAHSGTQSLQVDAPHGQFGQTFSTPLSGITEFSFWTTANSMATTLMSLHYSDGSSYGGIAFAVPSNAWAKIDVASLINPQKKLASFWIYPNTFPPPTLPGSQFSPTVYFDDFSLVAVPEVSVIPLFLFGVAAICLFRFRRARCAS